MSIRTAMKWGFCLALAEVLALPAFGQPTDAAQGPVQAGAAADAQDSEPGDQSEAPAASRVAVIVLKGSFPEGSPAPPLFSGIEETLGEAIGRIDQAAKDKKVDAVLLHLKSPSLGWGRINELRAAIDRVRASGKKVSAYMTQGTTGQYALASACDEILMPESGALMVLGIRAEVTFFKNLLDLLAVKADMLRVGEFKSAAEPYTRTEMSPEFRREMEEMLDDLFGQLVAQISTGRKLDPQRVEQLIDSGPHTATAAVEAGLVDHLLYEDQLAKHLGGEVAAKLVEKYGRKELNADLSGLAGMITMMNMMMGIEDARPASDDPKVAIVYASGMIMTGRSSASPFGGMGILGSDTMVKAINKAAGDDTVKAIVLRVDSPGGSALASDLIWRALEEVDKPIVVSMGDVAASGGYYISMGADRILAEPGTLTGSIGVVGGKFALGGLMDKVGITTTVIARGKNSGLLSFNQPFSESERAAMTKMLYEIYDQFTHKAAAGRGMEHEKLESLARGRVYTGQRAKEIGLVDELGTLEDAVQIAEKLAGVEGDQKLERIMLPKPPNPFEALFGPMAMAGGDSGRTVEQPWAQVGATVAQLVPQLRPLLNDALLVNLAAQELRLTILPFQVRFD